MNRELEKLVDIALVDGHITDKEREVLKRKATSLGFDLDELEMILDGRLFEQNKILQPQVNKCPNCGDIITGFTRICTSCDYVLNTTDIEDFESLEESFEALEESVDDLKTHKLKPGSTPYFNANFKIFITGGLYFLYKKLLKKERIYDSYRKINAITIDECDTEVEKLRRKYGNNAQVNAAINKLIRQRDKIIADRQKADVRSGLINFSIWGAIFCFIIYLAVRPPAPPTAEDKLQQYINDKQISAAKAMLLQLNEDSDKSAEEYTEQIKVLEIDSLINAGKYDEALAIANLLQNLSSSFDREFRIDKVIKTQVLELIAKKEFKQARKRAELASYPLSSELKQQISLAEELK